MAWLISVEQNFIGFIQGFLQDLAYMLLFGREGDDADDRPLPDILMIQFRNSDIEL